MSSKSPDAELKELALHLRLRFSAAGQVFLELKEEESSPLDALDVFMPNLATEANTTGAPQLHLREKYLDASVDDIRGPLVSSHVTRCVYIDPNLWTTPALPSTAVVPTLPHAADALAGFQEAELGDEDLVKRYPALQAMRTGFQVSQDSYTLGNYQKVPVVPGTPQVARQRGADTAAWLDEYLSKDVPSVHIDGLGASCFCGTREHEKTQQKEEATEERASATMRTPEMHDTKVNLDDLFANIYMGASFDDAGEGEDVTSADDDDGDDDAQRAERRAGHAPTSVASSEKALSKATAGGVAGAAQDGRAVDKGSSLSLTARNLNLKQKMETAGAAGSTPSTSVKVLQTSVQHASAVFTAEVVDDDDSDADLRDELRDAVTDLPINDEVEAVLQQSEMTAAAAPSGASAAANVFKPQLRAPRPGTEIQWATEKTVRNLDQAYDALRPNMAMQFPFELDRFQKEGVVLMEQGESIFVAAHTSAGKTVLAEYAFALAELHKTKAVYTAPVKAISNQKFRDFSPKFDVGLLTGDVQIKSDANCLIMTTEVLRSMLYRGANVVRDIEWVIFDEVHYISNDERGIVYEEIIIMLPPHINIVMLSATVPNKMELADWVGRTRQKVMRVTGTDKRPVPLAHSLYFSKELHTVCKAKTFDDAAYAKAKNKFKAGAGASECGGSQSGGRGSGNRGSPGGGNRGARGGGRGRSGGRPDAKTLGGRAVAQYNQQSGSGGGNFQSSKQVWSDLIYTLRNKKLLPCINFVMSKKMIDQTADMLVHLNLNTAQEKNRVAAFIDRSLARLKDEDRSLPQILKLRTLLAQGIGTHHAGLLPILKEIVEMLFCEGLVKVLFATETFAMGVNAPARTVTFWHINKPDGDMGLRFLRPDEYVQMAGRAGRRGLDDFGNVLVICRANSPFPEKAVLEKMMLGKSERLQSKFRLEYRMILSLLRVEDFNVEDVIRSSFAETRAAKQFPEVVKAKEEAEKRMAKLRSNPWPASAYGATREEAEEYVTLLRRVDAQQSNFEPAYALAAFQKHLVPGTVALMRNAAQGVPEIAIVLGTDSELAELAKAEQNPGLGSSSARWSKKKQPSTSGSAAAPGPSSTVYVLALHTRHATDPDDARAGSHGASGAADAFAGMRIARSSRQAWTPPALPMYGRDSSIDWALYATEARSVLAFASVPQLTNLRPLEILQSDPSQRDIAAATSDLFNVLNDQLRGFGLPLPPSPELNAYMRTVASVASHPLFAKASATEAVALVQSEFKVKRIIADMDYRLSTQSLRLLPDYTSMINVLKQLDFVSQDEVVKMKGRVACEITTCECLMATEAIFMGLFSELSPEEAVALLCAMVNQNRTDEPVTGVPDVLAGAVAELQALAMQLGELQLSMGLQDISPEDYVAASIRPSMTQVVYMWARGEPFSQVCTFMPTGVMEGDVVRTVTRLDQACADIMGAARVMGNTTLFDQFQEASRLIKRDVIFAGSLYIT